MWQMYNNSTSLCLKSPDRGDTTCKGYNNTKIEPYWMKVLAVCAAMEEVNEDNLLHCIPLLLRTDRIGTNAASRVTSSSSGNIWLVESLSC
jgi:hypothetical protein